MVDHVADMVGEEGPPGLRRTGTPPQHEPADGALGESPRARPRPGAGALPGTAPGVQVTVGGASWGDGDRPVHCVVRLLAFHHLVVVVGVDDDEVASGWS